MGDGGNDAGGGGGGGMWLGGGSILKTSAPDDQTRLGRAGTTGAKTHIKCTACDR